MSDARQHAGSAGPASAGPARAGRSGGAERPDNEAAPRVVIRDRRRIDPHGDKPRAGADPATTAADDPDTEQEHPDVNDEHEVDSTARPADAADQAPAGSPGAGEEPDLGTTGQAHEADSGAETSTDDADTGTGADSEIAAVAQGGPAEAEPASTPAAPGLTAELAALRGELDERTADLQRISAEYANYRKRVDRDRVAVGEQAVGAVLVTLLPVLDDLDRAREHGDLVGPFGSVADQLTAALAKFNLTPFGEKGDPFNPTRHEAVAHQTSADVTEPTCVEVLRRGYLLGDRLLRAALVAVADPE